MARPDDYKALVLEGSSTGAPFAAEGSTTYPKNMALVEGTFDEFSLLMWSVPVAANVVNSDKLKKVFGVTETIEPGKIYGSIEGGTARILYQPVTTHPGEHLSPTAIGYAIDWFQKTLGEEKTLAPSNQIWFWKEIATLIGLIGCILLVFAAGNLLLQAGYFSSLQGAPQNPNPASGVAWWVAAILMIIIGPLTYFPATRFAYDKFKESWLFPQKITNDIVLWLLVVTIISVILFVIWHLLNKKKGGNAVSYGLKAAKGSTWKKIGLSAWFAFLVTAVAYLSVMVISYFFTVDFRFWIMPIKPMSATQFKIALHYIIPLCSCFARTVAFSDQFI
jgi:hypothetical protein